MFSPGDEVRFLNEEGHGMIIRLLDKVSVLVKNDLGFEVPYPLSQLVKVKSAKSLASPSQVAPVPLSTNKPEPVTAVKPISIPDLKSVSNDSFQLNKVHKLSHLKCGFVQNKQSNSIQNWDLFLINSDPWPYYYSIRSEKAGNWYTLFHGSIDALSNCIVSTFFPEDLGDLKTISLQAIAYHLPIKKSVEVVDDLLKVKSPKLFNSNLFLDYSNFSKPLLVLAAEKKIVSQPITMEKPKIKVPAPRLVPVVKVELEVDLHIEKLEAYFVGLSNHEKLMIQLKEVRRVMDRAMAEHTQKVTFIHGIGAGVLKEETLKILRTYPAVTITNGDYNRYGMGATTVFFNE